MTFRTLEEKKTLFNKVEAHRAAGMSQKEAAQKVGINPATYYIWKKELAETGSDTVEVQTFDGAAHGAPVRRKRKKTTAHNTGMLTVFMGSPDVVAAALKEFNQ